MKRKLGLILGLIAAVDICAHDLEFYKNALQVPELTQNAFENFSESNDSNNLVFVEGLLMDPGNLKYENIIRVAFKSKLKDVGNLFLDKIKQYDSGIEEGVDEEKAVSGDSSEETGEVLWYEGVLQEPDIQLLNESHAYLDRLASKVSFDIDEGEAVRLPEPTNFGSAIIYVILEIFPTFFLGNTSEHFMSNIEISLFKLFASNLVILEAFLAKVKMPSSEVLNMSLGAKIDMSELLKNIIQKHGEFDFLVLAVSVLHEYKVLDDFLKNMRETA